MRAITRQHIDYQLLMYFAVLVIFGLMMLISASSGVRLNDRYFFISRQLLYGFLPGLFLFYLFLKVNIQVWKRLTPVVYGVMLTLLILVYIPGIGSDLNTFAHSWIVVAGFTFQPAELAKLALVLFLAAYLASKGKEMQDFQRGFLLTVGVVAIPIVLVAMQPDTGTVSILFAILFGMLFLSETKLSYMVALMAVGIVGFVIMIAVAPYRAERLMTFLNPDPTQQSGSAYQISQAHIAIGSGGWLGRGYGQSRQKFQYLPEVHADSIYAVIAEEMGFFFAVGLVILFVFIFIRGVKLAKRIGDPYVRLLVFGILIWFVTQAFLNIGAIIGMLPLTGVPLPFVSHGGTALMTMMGAVGLLLNASRG